MELSASRKGRPAWDSDARNVSSDNPMGLNPDDPPDKTTSSFKTTIAPAGWETGEGVAPLN
jgi:hypothetical protein